MTDVATNDSAQPAPAPAAPVPDTNSSPAVVVPTTAETAPPSGGAPSLLAVADAGKRDGAPEAPAAAAPATEPPAQSGNPPPTGEPKPEAKPEAMAEGGAPKPADPAAAKDALAQEPPAPPVYIAPVLPEGRSIDSEALSVFDTRLGELELKGKLDHAAVQEIRQHAIDTYLREGERLAEQIDQRNRDVWNRMKEGWINDLKADPELGGNRIETTLGNAKYAFESMLGLNKAQQTALLQVMDNAGVSDHPHFIRALHNLYERFREPEPVPANPPMRPGSREAGQRGWYDTPGASAA